MLHIPRGPQPQQLLTAPTIALSPTTRRKLGPAECYLVAGGGNIVLCSSVEWISDEQCNVDATVGSYLHLTRAPVSNTRWPQPAEQSSSAVSIAKMFCLSGRGGHAEQTRQGL